MGKLILQLQTSLDGFMGGPSGEMDWINWSLSAQVSQTITTLTAPINHILLGRKLAWGFIPHWLARPSHEPDSAIDKINSCRKTVFTRDSALVQAGVPESWRSTGTADTASGAAGDASITLTAQELKTAVQRLKSDPREQMIAYGGAQFVQSLLETGLVDEMYLFQHPVALGTGLRVFASRQEWKLLGAESDGNGVLILRYARK